MANKKISNELFMGKVLDEYESATRHVLDLDDNSDWKAIYLACSNFVHCQDFLDTFMDYRKDIMKDIIKEENKK